jgi:hypothetical protein
MANKALVIGLGVAGVGLLGLWWYKKHMATASVPGGSQASLPTGQGFLPQLPGGELGDKIENWVTQLPAQYQTLWFNQILPKLSNDEISTLAGIVDNIAKGSPWTDAQSALWRAIQAAIGQTPTPNF